MPGSKNSIADARWLHETGMGEAIVAAARRGTLVVGVCGGFQMLGRRLVDHAILQPQRLESEAQAFIDSTKGDQDDEDTEALVGD